MLDRCKLTPFSRLASKLKQLNLKELKELETKKSKAKALSLKGKLECDFNNGDIIQLNDQQKGIINTLINEGYSYDGSFESIIVQKNYIDAKQYLSFSDKNKRVI